jgi:hypothetical protein
MGPRPIVSPDWVIDHKNGTNLTIAGKSALGQQILQQLESSPQDPKPSTSRFEGVSRTVKTGPSGRPPDLITLHIGLFHTEREAAIASAASYVRAWKWAETSDLVVSGPVLPDALLSPEDA